MLVFELLIRVKLFKSVIKEGPHLCLILSVHNAGYGTPPGCDFILRLTPRVNCLLIDCFAFSKNRLLQVLIQSNLSVKFRDVVEKLVVW